MALGLLGRAGGFLLGLVGIAGLAALLPTFLRDGSREGAVLVLACGALVVLGGLWVRHEWFRPPP